MLLLLLLLLLRCRGSSLASGSVAFSNPGLEAVSK
jgi:hypothetical protein